MIKGFIAGLIVGVLIASSFFAVEAIKRNYGQFCDNGQFAWKGECDE